MLRSWVLDPQSIWDEGGGPPDPIGPISPPGNWPNSPHPVLGWGPEGLGKPAPRPPRASPQTHSHTTVPCLGASPCQPGQGAACMPAPSGQEDQGDRGGLWGTDKWGSCGHRKRKELGGGICWEAPSPTPCASHCHPGWFGWDPPGPEGQLKRALSPDMGGPQISLKQLLGSFMPTTWGALVSSRY